MAEHPEQPPPRHLRGERAESAGSAQESDQLSRRRIRVHYRSRFLEQVAEQQRWLAEHASPEWLTRLLVSLEQSVDLIQRFPEIGTLERQDEEVVVRRRRLADVPFVLLWAHRRAPEIRDVWLLGLFHYRQSRPTVDLSKWPW